MDTWIVIVGLTRAAINSKTNNQFFPRRSKPIVGFAEAEAWAEKHSAFGSCHILPWKDEE